MVAAAIIAAEVAFWVLLLGGLLARYGLRRPRLGAALLVGVPLVNVALLAITAADLARGAQADWSHGLAALYLGVSVAFGPSLMRAADRARRAPLRRGPGPGRPSPRPPSGWPPSGGCGCGPCSPRGFAAAMLGALVLVGGPADTRALWAGGGWFAQLALVAVVWLLVGPGLDRRGPARPPASLRGHARRETP